MAAAVLEDRGGLYQATSAGTLAVPGQPMGWRTRDALVTLGLPVPPHRSRQATPALLDEAALVVAMAREHVAWVRQWHPPAAPRTATLPWLAAQLPLGPAPLAERLGALHLSAVRLSEQEEVAEPDPEDPASYQDLAARIRALVDELARRLTPAPSLPAPSTGG
jgi:protein-tyrosine phosphatase